MRHTTFRFALVPTPAQAAMLARHAGASRFAYNQCLQLVTDALATKRTDPQVRVPWSGFDLINAYNGWKRSEAAGRIFVATPDGTITKQVTGLAWRHEVSAQVFEEAAVDLSRHFPPTATPRPARARAARSASRGANAKDAAGTVSGSATSRVRVTPFRSGSVRAIPAA
jgi:putative transposase